MKVVFLKRFSKDLDKIKQPRDIKAIIGVIEDIKSINSLEEISRVKKLKGFNNAYRIRSGDYRIGVFNQVIP